MKSILYKVFSIMALIIGIFGFSNAALAFTNQVFPIISTSGVITSTALNQTISAISHAYDSNDGPYPIGSQNSDGSVFVTESLDTVIQIFFNNVSGFFSVDGTKYFSIVAGTGDIYYFSVTRSGGSFVPSIVATRIISVLPLDGSVIATTTPSGAATTTNITGYINQADFGSSTQVSISYSNGGCSSLSVSALQSVNGDCSLILTYPITSSGDFSFSTTTLFNYIGQWSYVATIQNTTGSYCIFGYCIINNSVNLTQTNGSFKVGTTTAYDRLIQQIASSTQAVPPNLNGCNPFSGQFDLGGCTSALLIPSASDTQEFITSYTGQFLQYWPLGYVTRFIVILSSSTPQALPSISYTDTSGNPLLSSIGTIAFDPLGDLVASTSLFNTAVSNVTANPETIWQILGPLVQIIIYLTLIGMMLHDITGIFKHHK